MYVESTSILTGWDEDPDGSEGSYEPTECPAPYEISILSKPEAPVLVMWPYDATVNNTNSVIVLEKQLMKY